MLIFAVSLICALMLGAVYFLAYGAVAESVLVGFLLFVDLDSGQRALLNKRFPFSVKTRKKVPERGSNVTAKTASDSLVEKPKAKKTSKKTAKKTTKKTTKKSAKTKKPAVKKKKTSKPKKSSD